MNGLELTDKETTSDLIVLLRNNGLLTKATHDNIIRLAPPLIIDKKQIDDSLKILDKCLDLIK